MFTGIITQIGTVASSTAVGANTRIVLELAVPTDVRVGGSVSVNGACLTVVESGSDVLAFDLTPETLARTNLGSFAPGRKANIEFPMAANGRFDGHLVQGHVDGVGHVVEIDTASGGTAMTIAPGSALIDLMVEKGSVAVDGVSLTVAGVGDAAFTVALIPHTLGMTTLGLLRPGDTVNLEVDIIAKYVRKMLRVGE